MAEISRSDAGAINLTRTSEAIKRIIDDAREHQKKAICFVTGVPGAGKTLVGLNTATKPGEQNDSLSVFLSGNGPLVKILIEALARDKVTRTKREQRRRITKKVAASEVRAFIQNVHHFRDECLRDRDRPPVEHIALFDEAQRAWNLEQTRSFMKRKKNVSEFVLSEPEFLISCMDRHPDWAVIVCLVGGGQEINRGEAGIREWLEAVQRRFPHWNIYLSSRLTDSEYDAEAVIAQLPKSILVHYNGDLHLAVSIRSFRSENVSLLVKQILDLQTEQAQKTFRSVVERFPIVLTRDLQKAKEWLRNRARGSERFGIVASSNAKRLKPDAIDVKSPMDPVHWFLDGKEDVRSSYYLEDVATEFAIQGLELDWVCMNWDADFRFNEDSWDCWSFCGKKWQKIHKIEKQQHLKNAHRVLLTRARQGMVIVVPPGNETDPTRSPKFYDGTYRYLQKIGIEEI